MGRERGDPAQLSAAPSRSHPEDEDLTAKELTDKKDIGHTMFLEFFAGSGVLSAGVQAEGVPVAVPEDLASGGLDFLQASTVEILKAKLLDLAAEG